MGLRESRMRSDDKGRLSLIGYGFADSSKTLYSWFSYDPAGHLIVRNLSNDLYDWTGAFYVQQGYGINGLNQVATAGSTHFTYDLRGGLSGDGTNTYAYDAPHDQLASVSNVSSGAGACRWPMTPCTG